MWIKSDGGFTEKNEKSDRHAKGFLRQKLWDWLLDFSQCSYLKIDLTEFPHLSFIEEFKSKSGKKPTDQKKPPKPPDPN